jgi:hypothetical protein
VAQNRYQTPSSLHVLTVGQRVALRASAFSDGAAACFDTPSR